MRLSRAAYFGDFFVYPSLAAGIMTVSLWQGGAEGWPIVLTAFASGLALWTLGEYLLHRFVFHHWPYIKDLHGAHHEDQKALIGTPIWISLLAIGTIVSPLWFLVDLPSAAGLTAGVMMGYVWYGATHHGIHHWNAVPGSIMYALKRRHALHHHFNDQGNFGVTSGIWDKVFGTDVKVRKQRGIEISGAAH